MAVYSIATATIIATVTVMDKTTTMAEPEFLLLGWVFIGSRLNARALVLTVEKNIGGFEATVVVVGIRGAKINGGDKAIVGCAGRSIRSSKRRRASDVVTKNRKGLLSSRSSPLQRTVRYRVRARSVMKQLML